MQTKHYFAVDASPVEEVMFSTLPSGATEITIFPSKGGDVKELSKLPDACRSAGYAVVLDVDEKRGPFLKVTAEKAPERVLGMLMERGLFPAAPEERLKGEPQKISRIQKFRETALKYATRSAVVSHFILMINGWLTRDADKVAAAVTFASTNSLAAARGVGKRGGEVESTFARADQAIGSSKAGIPPVDALHFKERQQNIKGARKGLLAVKDFVWNKHPFTIGEAVATIMNLRMTLNTDGKQRDAAWTRNTFLSFLAGGTLGFVPPKPHIAEGEELEYPTKRQKSLTFVQTHSTKIGGVVNTMSNIFAVMSGWQAVKNYRNFKAHGESALVTKDKNNNVLDARLPENLTIKEAKDAAAVKEAEAKQTGKEPPKAAKFNLPKVPFLNKEQRYFATAVTMMAASVTWLFVGAMIFLGDKNKVRDKSDDQISNDLAAKAAEQALRADVAQQQDIVQQYAKFFGEQRDVKGKEEDFQALIGEKLAKLRAANPFLESSPAGSSVTIETPSAAEPEKAKPTMVEFVGGKRETRVPEASKAPKERSSMVESVGGEKPSTWSDKSEINPETRRENAVQASLA